MQPPTATIRAARSVGSRHGVPRFAGPRYFSILICMAALVTRVHHSVYQADDALWCSLGGAAYILPFSEMAY